MSRLQFSLKGFNRKLQISQAQMFAIVEGGIDRRLTDRMLSSKLGGNNIKHQVIAAGEIPGTAGGKRSVYKIFRKFRARKWMKQDSFGKKFVVSFFVDKDADDESKVLISSQHFFYTPTYDAEGHLISCGDINKSIADACFITAEQSQSIIPCKASWINEIVRSWKPWIALCLISQCYGLNTGSSYRSASQINTGPNGSVDKQMLLSFKNRLHNAMGISKDRFEKKYNKKINKIELSILNGKPLAYFKGKWLSRILQDKVRSAMSIHDSVLSGVGERVFLSLVSQTCATPSCTYSQPYEQKLSKLIEHIAP